MARLRLSEKLKTGCGVMLAAIMLALLALIGIDVWTPSDAARSLPATAVDVHEWHSWPAGFTADTIDTLKARMSGVECGEYALRLGLVECPRQEFGRMDFRQVCGKSWWDVPASLLECEAVFYGEQRNKKQYLIYARGYAYYIRTVGM